MIKFISLLVILSLFTNKVKGQFYSVQRYGIESGLKSDYLSNSFYDSKGFLWMSDGSYGVTRFDGKTFKNFNDKNVDIVVNSRFVEVNGHVRFVSGNTMYEIDGDSIAHRFKIDSKAYTKTSGERSVMGLKRPKIDADGIMWMGPDPERMFAFDGINTLEFKTPNRKFAGVMIDNENHCYYQEEKENETILHIVRLVEGKFVEKIYHCEVVEAYLGSLNGLSYTLKRNDGKIILTEFNGKKVKSIELSAKDYSGFNIGSIISYKNKSYICSFTGIFEINNSGYRFIPIDPKGLNGASPILYKDKILFGNYTFDGDTVHEIFPPTLLPNEVTNPINSVTCDNESNIWYTSISGLYKAYPTPIKQIKLGTGYYSGMDFKENQYVMYRSKSGNHDSLVIMDNKFRFRKNVMFSHEPNLYMQEFENDKYYFSYNLEDYVIVSEDFSVQRIKIDKSKLTPKVIRKSTNYVLNYKSVFSNKTGNLYFLNNNNLVIVNKGKVQLVELPVSKTKDDLNKLYLNKNEDLYICYFDLLLKFDGTKTEKINFAEDKLDLKNFTPILNYKDSVGLIFIPNDNINSVFLLDNSGLKEFKAKNKIGFSSLENSINSIRENYFWHNNSLLVPFEGFGIVRFNFDFIKSEVIIDPISKLEGFPSSRASSCIIDGNNFMWVFNNISRNIIQYKMVDFDNKRYQIYSEYFGSPLSAYQRPIIDKNGLIYATVDEGIVIVDPVSSIVEPRSNIPFLQKMICTSNDQQFLVSNKTNNAFEYHSSIFFEYNFIQFNNNKDLRFSYKLEGFDSNWQPETENRSINYTNLPAGNYSFHLKVLSNHEWIEMKAPITFIVLKPFWQQWWFVILCIVLLGTLIWVYTKSREKKLLEKQKQLERKIDEATSEIKGQKHLIEEKHKEITDSINYAERIQRSLLASKDLLNANLREHFVFFRPKDVVSGDFYWATKLTNDNFAIVTADSTGHGVPGAIMSILNISCIEKSIEAEKLYKPSEILNHTRSKIIETLKKDGSAEGGKDGMDCSLISFNPNKKKMTYSAANNPVWIIRQNELIELTPDKMPVGKHDRDNVSFSEHEIDLQANDMIYTLTDGYPDQFGGPKGKKFMYKKLKELLVSISGEPVSKQQEIINNSLVEWMGVSEQVDDITIIGIRV